MQNMLKRIIVVSVIVIAVILAFKYCEFKKDDDSTSLDYNTNLIQQQIVNVGKLVVTEGHFSEVVTYKNQQKYMMDMLSFEKKALIIVNADVTVSYDLHQMKYDIDEKNKTITIINIPKEEIKMTAGKIFSAQDRKRYYWTNIEFNNLPLENNIVLNNIIKYLTY